MRDTIGLTDFLEAEHSLSALSFAGPGPAPSDPLVRLASAVGTEFVDGRVLAALRPQAAVTEVLRRALSLRDDTRLADAVAAAVAHCRAGGDLWVVAGGFPEGPALRALLGSLQFVRSSVASAQSAGRVMLALEVSAYPRCADVLRYFERWLLLPEPDPVPPPSLPLPFDPAALARVRHWAEGSRDLALELFRLAAVLAHRRQAPSVEVEHVDEGAEALLARHAWLVHCNRVALNLPADLLALLLRCESGAVIAATGQLRPATLDQLVTDGVLTCAGPRGWRWSSRLHFAAVERARASARGDQFVRFFVRDRGESRLYSEVQALLRSGRADLTIDAVRKTVRVGERVSIELSGDRRCFRLLDFLVSRALDGFAVVTYEEILEAVYPDVDGADRTNIHPAITKLRQALGHDLWDRLAQNVSGVGYRVQPGAVPLLYVRPLASAELNTDGGN